MRSISGTLYQKVTRNSLVMISAAISMSKTLSHTLGYRVQGLSEAHVTLEKATSGVMFKDLGIPEKNWIVCMTWGGKKLRVLRL